MRRKCSRYGEGLVAGRGGEDLKNVASVRPLTVLPGVALGRVPAPGRSSLRRPESACPEGRALSRAALSRDCSGSRSPGGLAGAVRAAASAAEGILWRRGGRGEQSGQPGQALNPSQMEVLDEFDSEFPQSVTFCQLISEEDFERQAATCTERALRRLFRSLDRNPALAERVAKFFTAVQGELNCCNSMGALEMHQRLEQLKRSIYRVHQYSQDAKKKRRKPKSKKQESILLQSRLSSLCLPSTLLPPPPLPPPVTTMASVVAPSPSVYTMPRVFGPFPPLPRKSVEKLEVSSSEVKLNRTGLSRNPKSHMVDLTPLVLSPGGFHFSYLPGNGAHKLHGPGFPWTSACSDSPNTEETPSPSVKASTFTPSVLLKFQPVPRPKDDSENDPGSAESVPHKRSP
ncbi:uncharacterized protein LOC120606848 isoform X4 [Pteropus medius]|uniref:uncharacterized protein LOC120606848 isoform X4 n=1 Tax=Pteropus vampyrus TaxID=132908 RepID=UPI00196A9F83|nr:uncharacterized protein LOC120606848 isoform X4 [Pteropus giganteus]